MTHSRRVHRLVPALALATALAPAGALAQAPSAGLAASYEGYHFRDPTQTGIDAVSLLTVPVAVRVPFFLGSSLSLDGAYARGTLKLEDGSKVTLSGFTDTQLSLVLPVHGEMASVTAVAILPTGMERQTLDEAMLAGVIASELLPFRISNWGAGGAGGLAVAAAHSTGRFGLGVSASYLVGRRYDLLSEPEFGYRPGNQLRGRLALDLNTGSSGKASLQLTYLHSSTDQVDGANLYRSGDRVQVMSSYAFAAGARASGLVYAGLLRRARSTYLSAGPTQPEAQDLYLVGGGLRLPLGGWVLLPATDVRVVRRADGLDQGTIVGVGASAQIPIGRRALVLPQARARFGRVLVAQGSSTGFTGFDLGMGVRFGGAER